MLLFDTFTPSPTISLELESTARDVSSSLDTQQLTVDPPHADDLNQQYRFRGVESERSRWLELLPQIETRPRTVSRFETCGQAAWIQYSPSRKTRRVVSNTCRLRICPACRKALQRSLADRLWWALGTPAKNEWKFLTLTLRHTSAPLDHQLDFLRKSFRKLRQRRLFKKYVQHGWAIIELTYNEGTARWHPHLHCIVRCDFIPQKLISDAWNQITHGSSVVDIRIVKTAKDAAKYVAKYVGKPPGGAVLESTDLAREYYSALKGSRMLIAFGKERPELPKKVEDDYPDDWRYEEPLSVLLKLIRKGDVEAQRRLETVSAEPPYPYHDIEPPPPP